MVRRGVVVGYRHDGFLCDLSNADFQVVRNYVRGYKYELLIHTPKALFYTRVSTHVMGVTLYVVGSKSFRPDQLFKVTEINQLCYFST